jgi:hypothetical protein
VTQVRLTLTRPDLDGAPADVSGVLEWGPADAPVFADIRPGDRPVRTVDPGPWPVTEWVRSTPTKRHLLVPDVPDVVDYADLPDVDPATLTPTATPEAAWWAALHGLVRKAGPMTKAQYDAIDPHEQNVLYLVTPPTP